MIIFKAGCDPLTLWLYSTAKLKVVLQMKEVGEMKDQDECDCDRDCEAPFSIWSEIKYYLCLPVNSIVGYSFTGV